MDNMQIIYTSRKMDSHASTSPLSFYRPDALPAAQPTALKHWRELHLHANSVMNETNNNTHLMASFCHKTCVSRHQNNTPFYNFDKTEDNGVACIIEIGEAIKNPAYRIFQTEYSGCLDISAHA